MKLRYAWIDVPVFVLAVVLLIPFIAQLVGIVIGYIADLP